MRTSRMIALAVLAAALAGCNAEERAHEVKLSKGVYTGQPDTPISAEARAKLNERIALQDYRGEMNQQLRPSGPPAGPAAPIEGRISGQNY